MIDGSFCALPHSPSANEGPSRGGNDENDRECMGRDRLPFLLLLHDLLPWIIIYVIHVLLLVELFKELGFMLAGSCLMVHIQKNL